MSAHYRNIETGEIKFVDPQGDESAALRKERTKNGRFPLWEQTGAHDADPANHAAPEEVAARSRWGVPLPDVTADGFGQSTASVEQLDRPREGVPGPVPIAPAKSTKAAPASE